MDKGQETNITEIIMGYEDEVFIKNRGLFITQDECLKDSIEACKLLLTEGKTGGSLEDYLILKKGYEGFKNFIVHDFKFQELLVMASKVYILCINILYGRLSDEEAKPVNTFIGKKYKYIRQNIGVDLYRQLMKACEEENNHIKVLA